MTGNVAEQGTISAGSSVTPAAQPAPGAFGAEAEDPGWKGVLGSRSPEREDRTWPCKFQRSKGRSVPTRTRLRWLAFTLEPKYQLSMPLPGH